MLEFGIIKGIEHAAEILLFSMVFQAFSLLFRSVQEPLHFFLPTYCSKYSSQCNTYISFYVKVEEEFRNSAMSFHVKVAIHAYRKKFSTSSCHLELLR